MVFFIVGVVFCVSSDYVFVCLVFEVLFKIVLLVVNEVELVMLLFLLVSDDILVVLGLGGYLIDCLQEIVEVVWL